MGGKNVGRKFEKNASQSVKKEGGGARGRMLKAWAERQRSENEI